MAKVEATVIVDISPELAFAVSQVQGDVRKRWDTFIRRQEIDADRPAKGVRTTTRSRHGLSMVSEYTSFRPPTQVGMRMVKGPWFFKTFGGGWSFRALPDGTTEATWRYTFSIRPAWLTTIAEPIGRRILQRDIERRIAGYAEGCTDPVVLEWARATIEPGSSAAPAPEDRRDTDS